MHSNCCWWKSRLEGEKEAENEFSTQQLQIAIPQIFTKGLVKYEYCDILSGCLFFHQ